jgi:dihydrofolate reductase
MRQLVEITFMSLDGVIDAPDLTNHAQRYFSGDAQHDRYQKDHLFAADTLLLGRGTYEHLSAAYTAMEKTGRGAPMDLVKRMNSIPKLVASSTLKQTSWNATVISGDIGKRVREVKAQEGGDILKYGNGVLDRVLFAEDLIDVFCVIIYPFLLGHGTRLFDKVDRPKHLQLSAEHRFDSGTMVLEYTRSERK